MKLALSNSDTPGSDSDPLSNRAVNLRVRRLAFFAAGALFYWALASLIPYFQGTNITRLSPFFVGAAGYFQGWRAGTAAGLAAIVVHTVIFNRLGIGGPLAVLHVNPAVHIGILLVGPLTGRLRSLNRDLESEIADRKVRENGLLEAQSYLRQIVENMPEAFWICAADRGRMVYISPAFEAVFGIPPAGIENNPRALLDIVHPDDREMLETAFSPLPQDDYRAEYRINRPDGTVRWIQTRTFAAGGEDGTPPRIVGVSVDVTGSKEPAIASSASGGERNRVLEQLVQAQKMEAIGRLAGGIAHDFNNSLTSISGYGELLLKKLDPKGPLHRYAQEVMKASHRAAALTERLLAFGRQQKIRPREIDLNTVVRNMEPVLRRTIGENIELNTEFGAEESTIEVDPAVFEITILNLAINARDAMPEGGKLAIETGRVTVDDAGRHDVPGIEPGTYAIVTFSDTGVGMDGETQSRIFEPFFTTKERGRCAGLGLSTVYGAVRQSGGHVRVSSLPEQGSTFTIYFPLVERRTPVSVAREMFLGPSSGNETVLVAEDEPTVRRLINDVLESKGYRVLLADDGESALELVDEKGGDVHMLITDLVMPRMNGRELAARLRSRHPRLKVLYISGYIGKSSVKIAELGPGISFLSKPFSSEALARKIRLLLDSLPPPDKPVPERRERSLHRGSRL